VNKSYLIKIGFDGCNRIRVHISSINGELKDFICQYETLIDDRLSLDYAIQDLKTRWVWYKERFLSKRRK
jgi:hypothetical protein